MSIKHCVDDLAAYALGAVEDSERVEIETHIAVCPSCRLAADEAMATVRQIAFVAPMVPPPAELKQRLMSRIAAEAQPALRSRFENAAQRRPAARRPLFQRLAFAGVALALALSLGGNMMQRERVSEVSAERDHLAATLKTEWRLLGAGAVSRPLKSTTTAPAAYGSMYMRPGDRKAMLIVSGLQPLPPGQVYRFWLARDGDFVPVATFTGTADGLVGVPIEASSDLTSYRQVMITIESVDGSSAPGRVVLTGDL